MCACVCICVCVCVSVCVFLVVPHYGSFPLSPGRPASHDTAVSSRVGAWRDLEVMGIGYGEDKHKCRCLCICMYVYAVARR